ncbi:hypothetical protein BH10PAT1_BH10PAT1_0980 [soil metagenome]
MKIKKEVWVGIAILGFAAAWIIDKIAGPVSIQIDNPVAFLQSPEFINTYPLTTTAVIIRSIAIFMSVILITTFFNKKYFTKGIIILVCAILGEFYAIQQLATGFQLTTIQWTLSIAYGSVSLILGVIGMVLMGIWSAFNNSSPSEPLKQQSN